MKTWLLRTLGAIITAVVVTLVTDYIMPGLLPKPFHRVLHPEAALPPPEPANLSPASTGDRRHRAARSWCQAVKDQSDFTQKHFGEVSQAARDAFNENNCTDWGIRLE